MIITLVQGWRSRPGRPGNCPTNIYKKTSINCYLRMEMCASLTILPNQSPTASSTSVVLLILLHITKILNYFAMTPKRITITCIGSLFKLDTSRPNLTLSTASPSLSTGLLTNKSDDSNTAEKSDKKNIFLQFLSATRFVYILCILHKTLVVENFLLAD